ncbi:MAG: hypothetical protein NZ694_08135, partial [Tepidimonas sp.]|nr:hypothetical protein [Tepidimonas sp.]
MTPVHASTNATPCTSAAAQGRPGPARGPAHEADASSPADLFARLLADLQAPAEVPSDPAASPSEPAVMHSTDDRRDHALPEEASPLLTTLSGGYDAMMASATAGTSPLPTTPWGLAMPTPVTAMDLSPNTAGDD